MNSRALWNLSDYQKFLRITFDTCPNSDLKIGDGLNYVADIDGFAPKKYATVPDKSVRLSPGPEVAGQILLDRGELFQHGSAKNWRFAPSLKRGNHIQSLQHGICVRMKKLTTFKILTTDETGAVGDSLALQSVNNEDVRIAICNLSDRNPLRWPVAPYGRFDDDFRWYYELSKAKADLPKDLHGLLPVPEYLGSGNSSHSDPLILDILTALGQNCFEAKFQPVGIDF